MEFCYNVQVNVIVMRTKMRALRLERGVWISAVVWLVV